MADPKRTPPLPPRTDADYRAYSTDTPRTRAASKRYGTSNPAMLEGAIALSDRLRARTPMEQQRDRYGSIDSDIDLPNLSGKRDPRLSRRSAARPVSRRRR